MVKKIAVTFAISSCLAIGLVALEADANEAIEVRKDVREAAGVEAGDRVDRRREVRDYIDREDRAVSSNGDGRKRRRAPANDS